MKKKLITTKKFIERSIGEWKSIRSTHSLAFQDYENTNSHISIANLSLTNKKVKDLVKKFNFEINPEFAVTINWRSESDWLDEQKVDNDETLMVFLSKNLNSGIILRDKGYAESIPSCSEYFLNDKNCLNLTTIYNSTLSEENIWFLSKNVRTRFSVIKNKTNNAIIQTSHSSEIRDISN